MNIRLKLALEDVKRANERLEALLIDLSTREGDSAYQKAKKLFDEGARMAHHDGGGRYEEVIMWHRPRNGHGNTPMPAYLAGGTDRNGKKQWDAIGAKSSEECDTIIRHLLNLTEEAGAGRSYS